MYTIVLLQNGKYFCCGRLQDGKEEWSANTLEEAVSSMKTFAKTMNGTKLKKKHITYLQEKPVTKAAWIEWKPFGDSK